jgi:hypothetical protein
MDMRADDFRYRCRPLITRLAGQASNAVRHAGLEKKFRWRMPGDTPRKNIDFFFTKVLTL